MGNSSSDKALRLHTWQQRLRSGLLGLTPASLFSKILAAVGLALLARVLTPADFGVFAASLVLMMFVTGAIPLGLRATFAQYDDPPENYYQAVWATEVARSMIAAVVAFIVAVWVGDWMGTQDIIRVLPLVALGVILHAAASLGDPAVRPVLGIERAMLVRLLGTTGGVAVALGIVVAVRNYWALAAGFLVAQAMITALTFAWGPYRPRMGVEPTFLRELLSDNRYILIGGAAVVALQAGQCLVVGTVFGAEVLGYYAVALFITAFLDRGLISLYSSDAVPGLFRTRRADPEMRAAYLRSVESIAFVIFPAVAFVIVFAEEIVLLVLGTQWNQVAPLLRVLALVAVAHLLGKSASSYLITDGRAREVAKYAVLRLLLAIACIYHFMLFGGPAGAAAAVLLAYVGVYLIQERAVARLLAIPLQRIGRAMLPFGVGALGALGFGLVMKQNAAAGDIGTAFGIGVGAVLMIGVYLLLIANLRPGYLVSLQQFIARRERRAGPGVE